MGFRFEKMFGIGDPTDKGVSYDEEIARVSKIAKSERAEVGEIQKLIDEINQELNMWQSKLEKGVSEVDRKTIVERMDYLFGEREKLASMMTDSEIEASNAEKYIAEVETRLHQNRKYLFSGKISDDSSLQ